MQEKGKNRPVVARFSGANQRNNLVCRAGLRSPSLNNAVILLLWIHHRQERFYTSLAFVKRYLPNLMFFCTAPAKAKSLFSKSHPPSGVRPKQRSGKGSTNLTCIFSRPAGCRTKIAVRKTSYKTTLAIGMVNKEREDKIVGACGSTNFFVLQPFSVI